MTTLAYSSGVIAAKPLLVASRLYHGGVLHLLKHVDICLALFLSLLLIIEVDAWGVNVKVRGDDHLGLIDKEERRVAHQTVHAHP
jgi:hypothetical protein